MMSYESKTMAFSLWHIFPSGLCALLIIALAFPDRGGKQSNFHRRLSYAMVLSAALGLAGYINPGNLLFYTLDGHVLHSWLGLIAFLLSVSLFLDSMITHILTGKAHCKIGYIATAFALLALLSGLFLLAGGTLSQDETLTPPLPVMPNLQDNASSILPEKEAGEYRGKRLVPIAKQGNNAFSGTQHLDREALRLNVTGLIMRNLSIGYEEMLKLPAYSELVYMP